MQGLRIVHGALVVAAIVVLAAIGCHNEPTVPAVLRPGVIPSGPERDVTYELIGIYTIPSPTDSSSPSAGVSLPGFAQKTLLRATISGSVTTSLTPFNHGEAGQPTNPGAPRTFGPT